MRDRTFPEEKVISIEREREKRRTFREEKVISIGRGKYGSNQ